MLQNKISSHDLQHQRQMVDQLRREVKLDRLKVSQCANDILQYCEQQETQDPLPRASLYASDVLNKRICVDSNISMMIRIDKAKQVLDEVVTGAARHASPSREIATELQKFVTEDAPPNPPDPPPVSRPRSQGIRERRRTKRLEEIRRAKYVVMETTSGSRSEREVGTAKEKKRRRRRRAENSSKTGETDTLLTRKNKQNRQKLPDGDLEKVTSMSFPTLPSLFMRFKKPRRQQGTSKPTKDFLHQAE
ncbi:uncharacterized protein LOC116304681 [Actinia tenebrosa]|uniref:Guanine nucleotide-binding protein subunit gamma n=1 Tax=Actinia tenebrosa TaxID=6105 RepID=A0A6P8ITI3_ACTTE|nr:uncharacterized protein LOC116304681 [Actinia tenebrosa]